MINSAYATELRDRASLKAGHKVGRPTVADLAITYLPDDMARVDKRTGKALGVSQAWVWKLETGRIQGVGPSTQQMIEALAAAYSELLEETIDPQDFYITELAAVE